MADDVVEPIAAVRPYSGSVAAQRQFQCGVFTEPRYEGADEEIDQRRSIPTIVANIGDEGGGTMGRWTTWTWALLSGIGLAAVGPISTAFAADPNGTSQDNSGWRGTVNGARSSVGGAAESAGNGVERAKRRGTRPGLGGKRAGGAARQTGNAAESQAQESDREAKDSALAADVKGKLSKQGSDASRI